MKQTRLEERTVLEPDNPLLEKFQKALKEHLLYQIEVLKSDIFEYETGTKKKNAEREELGLRVYEGQQIANKQQCIMDNCIKQLETVSVARLETARILNERKEVYKKERQNLIRVEYEEIELKKEVEAANLLIYQVSKWENAIESNINAKQRSFEKCRQEKLRLLEEKRLQDGLIYKLMMRTWELEAEIEKINMQLDVVEVERQELAQTVALGNTNIKAIGLEYKSLMNSWNSVIMSVGNRDKVLNCLFAGLHKLQEKYKSSITESEQITKLCNKEMGRNEYLTMVKRQHSNGIATHQALINKELTTRDGIQRKINELQAITEQSEENIEKISIEMRCEKTKYADLMRRFEKMMAIKTGIEEDILKMLEDRATHDTAAMGMKGELRETRKQRRDSELTLVKGQSKISTSLLQAEIQQTTNDITQGVLDEVENQVRNLQNEKGALAKESREAETLENKLVKDVDILNRSLQKNIDNAGGVLVSPIELKISVLEKEIHSLQIEIKGLEQFWIKEQGNLILVSGQRQEQISNANLLRKQAMLMEQNNLRITDSLNEHKSKGDKITRDANHLNNKLKMLSEKLHVKHGVTYVMRKDNEAVQLEFTIKLKNTELECLKLSSEIEQIENDKVSFSDKLIELNREALEWEKKFHLAKEAKKAYSQEKEQGGEVGNMRMEIHRMQVRHGQLKMAQNKLVDDLGNCIARRDVFVNVARVMEKKVEGGLDKIRYNFGRKLDDMRNKIKRMENETEGNREKIENALKTYESLEFEVGNLKEDIERNQSTLEYMKDELEETKSERQLNFELVLLLQKRLALFQELRKGRKPFTSIESGASADYANQRLVNLKLSNIIDDLKIHFPNQRHQLTRMENTLNLTVTWKARAEEKKQEEKEKKQ